MAKVVAASLVAILLAGSGALEAQEAPKFSEPTKEHAWLKQLAGEWNTEGEAMMAPNQPPIKCKGTASTRSVGGFWVISEIQGGLADMPMTGIMTVGYDPEKKQYVGTWVDSMTSRLWKYKGTVDEAGKVLTLEAEGPDLTMPGKTTQYRDAIEVKGKDHLVFTSSMRMEDGTWLRFMTMDYRRKK